MIKNICRGSKQPGALQLKTSEANIHRPSNSAIGAYSNYSKSAVGIWENRVIKKITKKQEKVLWVFASCGDKTKDEPQLHPLQEREKRDGKKIAKFTRHWW